MTAVGTFALDTNTYLTSLSGAALLASNNTFTNAAPFLELTASTGTNPAVFELSNTDGLSEIGIESSGGGQIITGDTPYALALAPGPGGVIQFGTGNGNAVAMTVGTESGQPNVNVVGVLSAGAGSTDYSTASSAQVAHCLADGTGCPSTTAAVSGMTAGYIPLAATAATITGNSHLDDGVTLSGVLTSSEQFLIDYSSPTRTSGEIYNATGHAWFLNSTGSSGYASAPANSLSFQDGTGMVTPLYLTSTAVVALQPVSMPTGSTVNSTNICLADGTGCPGGTVYNISGMQPTAAHTVIGSGNFNTANPQTITFSGLAAFTAYTSYECTANTSNGAPVAIGETYSSGTQIIFSGPLASGTYAFICIGN
jgi:hypothetical protein